MLFDLLSGNFVLRPEDLLMRLLCILGANQAAALYGCCYYFLRVSAVGGNFFTSLADLRASAGTEPAIADRIFTDFADGGKFLPFLGLYGTTLA